jgi:hypothetical protein
MRRHQWNTLPPEVAEVHEQLESWRQTRPKRSPIPEAIWEAAAALAAEHGLHRVAKALGLNYPDLKRRVQTVAATGHAEKMLPLTFVEFTGGPSWPAAPCVVEVENRAGVKMKISLREPSGADLAALIQAFLPARGAQAGGSRAG